jgi:hypothetical protein
LIPYLSTNLLRLWVKVGIPCRYYEFFFDQTKNSLTALCGCTIISNHAYGAGSSYAASIIDVEALRKYRENSFFGNWMKDLRTEQYKLIYEEPLFEKNLCLDRPPLKHKETDELYRKHVQKLMDKGIWVPSSK